MVLKGRQCAGSCGVPDDGEGTLDPARVLVAVEAAAGREAAERVGKTAKCKSCSLCVLHQPLGCLCLPARWLIEAGRYVFKRRAMAMFLQGVLSRHVRLDRLKISDRLE